MRGFAHTRAKGALALFVLIFSSAAFGQAKRPPQPPRSTEGNRLVKVTLVDEIAFKKLLVPNGKPLLINFWATWCDPCREEFPDLVKLDQEYKGKIDFLTVSLDDPADIATTVPKFLGDMKAWMPAYLLKTADESAVIASVTKDWQGGMPFTVLYGADGKISYFRQGKIALPTIRTEIDKLLPTATLTQP